MPNLKNAPLESQLSIAFLPELIAALPSELQTIAERLFFIERVKGHTVPPPLMQEWIRHYFGDIALVCDQTIVKIVNRFTLEAATYNPLRGQRPQEAGENCQISPDEALEAMLAANAGSQDTFHDPLNGTTADLFGRIRGKHCLSASNVAKYDGWHGLVIFDEFHPLRFNLDQFQDYFAVALRWLIAAQKTDSKACYPLITWNCLWKGGASIVHGHLQMTLSQGMAAGQVERWRRATIDYHAQYQSSLFADLAQLKQALRLTFHESHAVWGYASLIPVKDREVVLMPKAILQPEIWAETNEKEICGMLEPLWAATYTALRELIDGQGMRSFNLAVYLPPCRPTTESWAEMPICVRIVDRGNPLTRLVNIGAMELFANNIANTDPFALAQALREA